jgi:hypothetical protein
MPATIHFIDGDRTNCALGNMVALCPEHFIQAQGVDPQLPAEVLRTFKRNWERQCIRDLIRDAGCACKSGEVSP